MMEIEIPAEVPGMTLSHTVLFPHAIMPLYIFESRYRKMITDVLASHRIFLVAHRKPNIEPALFENEATYEIATAGIIRMCSHNKDGTSNLMIQGLTRVRLNRRINDTPYPLFDITPIKANSDPAETENQKERQNRFLQLVRAKEALGITYPPEVRSIFEKLHNVDMLADLASHIFCNEDEERQNLLETFDSHKRLDRLMKTMRKDIAALRLKQELQGELTDDDIPSN